MARARTTTRRITRKPAPKPVVPGPAENLIGVSDHDALDVIIKHMPDTVIPIVPDAEPEEAAPKIISLDSIEGKNVIWLHGYVQRHKLPDMLLDIFNAERLRAAIRKCEADQE